MPQTLLISDVEPHADGVVASPVAQHQALAVLIIHDDRPLCDRLILELKLLGCRAHAAGTEELALSRCRDGHYQLVLCDAPLIERAGPGLIARLLASDPAMHIVLFASNPAAGSVVEAMRAGAADYRSKPICIPQVRELIAALGERHRLLHSGLPGSIRRGLPTGIDLDSNAPAMHRVLGVIACAARAEVPVLLRGENGTGKSVLAQALHAQSPRARHPFVTINCPSLGEELLTSELFGHVKGSFTGAIRDQMGKVQAAEGGTLFLDELGDLPARVQARLLRFLHERRYERLGDTTTRTADVRIVAATNRDLDALVDSGGFREDLLYRLNVIEITVPPLRDRQEDIPLLAQRFLAHFADEAETAPRELSSEAIAVMQAYPWPGNVRELRNELQRITVLWPSQVIAAEAFSQRVHQRATPELRIGGDWSLAEIESEHIRKVVARTDTFEQAAGLLGIEPSTLWRKRCRLGL